MEFIKTMKKREFIEMTLKTIAAICACFIAIILMEGMIYGIGAKIFQIAGPVILYGTLASVIIGLIDYMAG